MWDHSVQSVMECISVGCEDKMDRSFEISGSTPERKKRHVWKSFFAQFEPYKGIGCVFIRTKIPQKLLASCYQIFIKKIHLHTLTKT